MTSTRRIFPAILALGVAVSLAAQAPSEGKIGSLPQSYGTQAVSYVEVPAAAFMPIDSQIAFNTNFIVGGRYSTGCSGDCLAAPLHLPGGAKIVYLELDVVDTNSAEYVIGSLVRCNFAGEDCSFHPTVGSGPADCASGGGICSGKAFAGGEDFTSADLTPDGLTVNNFINSYQLVAGACCDGSTRVGGMIVGYVLQVSAPPGLASFSDVPTNHPYFTFIEAILASGITGGCQQNPLKYCPDRPITRGEMAVFLAKALGLQFP